MINTSQAKLGTYKGHQYRVLFFGETKFGKRAHLEFMNGTKDFWVSGDLVTIESAAFRAAANRYGRSYVCDECGERALPGTECWETGLLHS